VGEQFRKFAQLTAAAVGSPITFALAVLTVIVWALTGPTFHYSDTWQLVINTGTTIITFLMVFLIQNTQNRESRAFHIKLDELIRANHSARNRLMNLDALSDKDLDLLHQEFCELNKDTEERIEKIKQTKKNKASRKSKM
jgi:low affinity Fe/Cu permease